MGLNNNDRFEINESGGNVHEDFIRFKEAIDEGDLFKAIKYQYNKDSGIKILPMRILSAPCML